MSLSPKLYNYWIKLTGEPSRFPLHVRIFHSVCLVSMLGLAYNIPLNYLINLDYVAVATFVVLIITCVLYYQSRVKGRNKLGIYIINIVGLALFSFNYFFNSGISGPTDMFFLLFLLLMIVANPADQYKYWIPANIIIVVALHLIDYYNPGLVPNNYANRKGQFIDETSAYVVIAVMISFCINYLLRSYEIEKKSALEKSDAIIQKNRQILIQNQELEKLSSEKSKLMSIVAHDLRSPLASIQNYLELLKDVDLEEKQKQEIQKGLLDSTKDTLSMLAKLLAWTKSQTHGITPFLKNLELKSLLEDTLKREKDIAGNKGIELDYYFEPSAFIYADNDMMQLIVRNFVGNAIKFTPSGGSITVRAESNDQECTISIKDTGIGISRERQKVLFSLNAKSTFGTQGEKGVGLGLLLCTEYIKAQNGRIRFESNSDSGTCFYVTLPLFGVLLPENC